MLKNMFSYIQEAMPSGIWLSCTKLGDASGSVDMHFFSARASLTETL